MSNFLGYDSFLVPLGDSIEQCKQLALSSFTSRGWQKVAEGIGYQAILGNLATPANVFDDSEVNGSMSSSLPCTIGLQLSAAATVTSYVIGPYGTPAMIYAPTAWTLEYSDNGSTWTVADTRTGESYWQLSEKRIYTVGGSPGSHLYWRLNISAVVNSTVCNLSVVRFFLSSGVFVTTNPCLYLIPPAGELIGNSTGHDTVYMSFTATGMTITPYPRLLAPLPETICIYPKTAGAVACSLGLSGPGLTGGFGLTASISGTTLTVTASSGILGIGTCISGAGLPSGLMIGGFGSGTGGTGTYALNMTLGTIASESMTASGSMVSGATGTAGSSATDNLRALYVALRGSSDPNFSAFTWKYQKAPAQNANDTNDYIYGTQVTPAANVFPIGTNCNCAIIGNFTPATIFPNCGLAPANSSSLVALTYDLVNGFIFYIQVNSRGLAIATKTNVAFYGPLHACYGSNATALAAMPASLDSRLITPIELLVGPDGASSNANSTAIPAKFWGLASSTNYQGTTGPWQLSGGTISDHPFTMGRIRDTFFDEGNAMGNSPYFNSITLYSSGLFTGASTNSDDDFQIHRMSMGGINSQSMTSNANMNPTVYNPDLIVPLVDITDWYKCRGTFTSESLALVADTVVTTTMAQAMDDTTAYTTLAVASTTGLQAAGGMVVIESEIIAYTGFTGNTLTGVTRAKYGTAMQNHWVGDTVWQGLWFTIINGGALFCGYTKPV